LPEGRLQAAYQFPDEISAAKAVSEMTRYGLDLAAIEFLDRAVIRALNQLKDYKLDEAPVLFLEFHGPAAATDSNARLARQLCEEVGGVIFNLPEGQHPWEMRHYVTEAIKHRKKGHTIVRNDVAFPISRLPEMVAYCHELGQKYDVMMHTFGHVGMGLLHALMLADQKDAKNWATVHKVNDLIIKKSVELGGTVSGEHGIGLGHKGRFVLEHGRSVNLMRGIKKVFDPAGILNPGKIFDLSE
jgi:D-lactate dehydrogenase (cytochrome)